MQENEYISEIVRIQVDLSTGSINVEAPPASLDVAFDKLSDFLPQLIEAYTMLASDELEADNTDDKRFSEPSSNGVEEQAEQKKTKRKSGLKKETYEVVELELDDEQRQSFRAFFVEKAPKSQNDQIATIMFWLQRERKLSPVGMNEIFTGFRIVGARVPGKISSVLGSLAGRDIVRNTSRGRYQLTHVGEDFVNYNLPPKGK